MTAAPDIDPTAGLSAHGAESGAAMFRLSLLGAATIALTLTIPFALRMGGDHAYMALAIATGLVAVTAACVAERMSGLRAFWLIIAVAVLLRGVLLFTEPLLSSDIYRYVWDGRVQAAGINPYRYFPAHEALAPLRDGEIYPNVNRADYAVTIYPPVAQMFYFLTTRLGESVTVMKFALLACEAGMAVIILLLLRQIGRPPTRIVAYAWHPLPMWEIANNGHIDGLMIALMMLGLWLALSGRPLRGAVAVALAALAKPFAVLALPAIWRRWDWKMPLVVLAVGALSYAPYLSVGTDVLGFLTRGYLNEEHLDTGSDAWPLAAIRYFTGPFHGDFVIYLAISALIIGAMALRAADREPRTSGTALADVNRLLLVFLLLLSPNYPWYFLALTPFVALVGGAPVWAATLGALLLQEEVAWDAQTPILIRKSILYGMVLAACAYAAWKDRKRISAAGRLSDERHPAR